MSDQGKELIFDEEAREFLRSGIKQLTELVSVTLGPKGRHIGLDAAWGPPTISNDGSSIAKDVELKNQYENMGATMGKEVASKMKELCGDGTTTSIILLGCLVEHGIKNIASGSSPIHMKRGMEKAFAAIVSELEKKAHPVENQKDIEEIATASASGSEEVGKMIAEAFEKVGTSGVISIEEAKGTETTIEMAEGMQFDRGYVSPYFATNTETMVTEMSSPRILVTDKKISSIQEILEPLQTAAQSAQEILIIADDIEGDALSTLVVNRLRGTLKVCAVKAPGFGEKRKSMLQDIAILTGAKLISEEMGSSLKDADSSALGGAEKVLITKDSTTIIGGEGTEEAIDQRVKHLEVAIGECESTYDKERLEERRAKLSGGIALIRVGAPSEPAMKQLKQVYEDSLNSTYSALEEGIVVGGGIALLRASLEASGKLKLSNEEAIGAKITFEACQAPVRQLIENSGFESSLILEQILGKKEAFGFNAKTEIVEDLYKAGIRDPLKVVKSGLNFSISAAGMILLSECLMGDSE